MDSRAQALDHSAAAHCGMLSNRVLMETSSVLMGIRTFPWGVYKWDSFSRESRVRGQGKGQERSWSQIHIDWLLKADRRSQHRKSTGHSTPRR